ncbi:sigma-70 family RNA polymerase sigma factor [Sporosarcina limicola]|nr:sigma-70 family RNA polymerase sigma factor [Sporosarcina limicola]
MKFEVVLKQYEPMISATIRKLNIYRDYDQYRQAGRIALWQAWERFDETKGNFTPYASRSIRGAMLDELKKESRFNEHVMQMEDEFLDILNAIEVSETIEWSDFLNKAFALLKPVERELVHRLFVEGLTLAEYAEEIGISVAGVKKRRERLLVKLRGMLVLK